VTASLSLALRPTQPAAAASLLFADDGALFARDMATLRAMLNILCCCSTAAWSSCLHSRPL
jgi:hypothetical protein